jgi:thymidylate synthase
MTTYRNTTQAFKELLSRIGTDGANITVRSQPTLELRSELIEITNPIERCIVIPGRGNNIFATIAETMWVLCGRNDIAFLEGYLRRAADFSDDGTTWRAGYGPRLRRWNGTDQLAAVKRMLTDDPNSRRAVISLYDPDSDFIDSKDIPCNNWLHFLGREGRLHLNVVARSTDLVWGFSAINAFEWSVLQEMMAYWLGLEVGEFRFFASSLHIYERHYKLLENIDTAAPGTVYDQSPQQAHFATEWTEFDATLEAWMNAESAIRQGLDFSLEDVTFSDPLLLQFIQMIDVYWTHKRGGSERVLNDKLSRLGGSDLGLAACEYLERNSRLEFSDYRAGT